MIDQQSNMVGFVLKGYPRLSETFIAQEILELERCGLNLHIFSLRPPREKTRHKINDQIKARITYLPEYLTGDTWRILISLSRHLVRKNLYRALREFLKDCRYGFSADRILRFAQAVVLSDIAGGDLKGLHAHFLHTPASVAKYAAIMMELKWSCSAHAVDIWTLDGWEKRRKINHMQWLVTCTKAGKEHLSKFTDAPEKLYLAYHGIDLNRFSSPPRRHALRNGSQENTPVLLLSVGRLVEKKGYDILLDALARIPDHLNWRWSHAGDGVLREDLKILAERYKLTDRISWLGSCSQDEILELYRNTDIFVLPSRIAANGDRDGLPNVLMEAQSQAVPCLATDISAVPELIEDEVTGLLVPSENAELLKNGLVRLIEKPELRDKLGHAGQQKVVAEFSHTSGIKTIADLLLKTYL